MGIPNSIADVVQSIRDGEVGLIDVIKIGDLTVSQLTGLSVPKSLTPTRKPVQAGFAMTDAAVFDPRELNMQILLANPDFSIEAGTTAVLSGNIDSLTKTWRDDKRDLEKKMDELEILTIQTHEGVYESMLITLIDPLYDVDDNSNAFIATVNAIQITQVQDESTGGLIDSVEEVYGEL
jgi:hypothetical protein